MSYRFIGKSNPIHDAYGKVTGCTKYAGDMVLPGMVYCEMIFSPYPNANVINVDVQDALKLPGVIKVFYCFNTSTKMFNRFKTVSGQQVYEQERVFNQHVRFVGDRVAAVAATSPEIAKQAAKLVRIEYEELPFSLSIQKTLEGMIDDIFEDGAVYEAPEVTIGDVQGLDKTASAAITTHTELKRITHVTMETHCCIADYKKETGILTIQSPTQSVFSVRMIVGDLLDMPYHKVRVIKTTMGGSFGSKQEWITEPVAAYMAKDLARPVKVVYDRRSEQISTVSRCPMSADITSFFSSDGTLLGIKADASLDAGGYVGSTYDYALAMSYKFTRSYRVPNLQFSSRAVITNTPVSGAYRGWTSPEETVLLEHNVNMAARKLGMDPIDIRIKNAYAEGDIDLRIGVPIENTQIVRALKEGRALFNWDQKKKDCKMYSGRYRRGVGVACGSHVNGYYPRKQDFGTAELSVNEDGSLHINMTLHDHGCGSVTAFKMIAAESLGIDMSCILLGEGDTAVTPFDMGCFSSRSVYVLGRTLLNACAELKEEIIQNASLIYGIPKERLSYKNGSVWEEEKQIASLKDIGQKSILTLQKQLRTSTHYTNTTNPGVHGVHFAEIEVDTYTGFVKILDYLAVHDIGQTINRKMCIAQIQGAVMMGIGTALQEKLAINSHGVPKSSLKDYHLLTSCDLPPIRVHLIEEHSKNGPYGAKSVGEVSYVPVTAAIVGAVNDALESDLCSIPLDPETIIEHVNTMEK